MKRWSDRTLKALLWIWGGGIALAFWQFEGQYFRPVSRPAGAAEIAPEQRPLSPVASLQTTEGALPLSGPGPVTLLNFWNPSCPCSRFMEGHVRKLMETYAPRGVRFVTVVACEEAEQARSRTLARWQERGLPVATAAADPGGALARRFGVWAAPAAVILDREGRVVYVGAYNAARYCDDPQSAWAAQALTATLEGRKPRLAHSPFYGCQVPPGLLSR
ncbi:MAG TPA: redoxin family protein [Chthonomonadaceae bacterium]|nr:redoxin family protein [Chthonomonadaceae bacterium]